MRRLGAPLAAVLLAASSSTSCGGGPPIPAVDLSLAITLGARDVASGQAFPITVVRVWSKDLSPEEWSDRALAPLVLRLESESRREDGDRVEETRRFRGYAFTLSDVTIPGPKWKATLKAGGPDRVARAEPIRLRVKPALDPASPGPPEPPGEPLAERAARWPLLAALAIAVAALAVLLRRRSRRRSSTPAAEPAAPTTPSADPARIALAVFARIEGRRAEDIDSLRADVAEVASVLRAYLGGRFAIRAGERTTEETLAEVEAVTAGAAGLTPLFRACDRVKFAAHAPTAAERGHLLRDAGSWVRETEAQHGAAGAERGAPR